jgi:GxxExxY protein
METENREKLNLLSKTIIDAAVAVHREIGPGLLEAIYHDCLIKELQFRKINFKTAVEVPIVYKKERLDKKYILDLLVEDEIVIELKSVEQIIPVHEAQLLTYLKVTGKRLGLLINFNVPQLIKGVTRMVNKF